ncbi:MAG: NADH-quinone oxidoreductase subunit M [Thermoleophilia bacterium]|nr:NADH-quinone oxidoreductase subunit M [Thermoleophilia bacterium]
MPWLTILLALPIVGGLVLMLQPRLSAGAARGIACLVAPATFGVACGLLFGFHPNRGPQRQERHDWISSVGLEWTLRLDGISLALVMLTALIFMITVCALVVKFLPERNPAVYLGLILVAEGALMGLWLAGNLLLFYVFWELMLVPFYFLIGVWGAEGRRQAVTRFVIYTMFGSLIMLVGIVATGVFAQRVTGQFTLDIEALRGVVFTEDQSRWLFAAFALAFAIKLPLFPFHGWLPGAYGTAPIAVTVLLAAVMSKAGAYGFMRIGLPVFPDGAAFWQNTLIVMAVVGIIYGSVVAWRAPTMRLVVAYSSLAHLGFVAIGIMAIDPQAAQGAVLQMVNHGLVVAAAFAVVGLLARRSGREGVDDLGGLADGAPWLAGVFLMVTMASLAIPGSNSWAGEFFILVGAFRHSAWAVILASLGTVYASVYMLRLYQRTMNGPRGATPGKAVEMGGADWAMLAPLVAVMGVIALWPHGVLRATEHSVERVVAPAQQALNRPASEIKAAVPANPPETSLPLPGDPLPQPTSPTPNTGATP